MPRPSSLVVFGVLLLFGFVVAAFGTPAYVLYEQTRTDRICYSIASVPPLTLDQAANEQSVIEDTTGLGAGSVTITSWNLREGCESGTYTNASGFPRGLPIRNQDTCGSCWANAHTDFVTLWHCQQGNTNDLTKKTQVASLQQHIDCIPSVTHNGVRNDGCGTGSLKLASLYYMGKLTATNIKGSGATFGLASEADYPMTYNSAEDRVIVRDPIHNHGQCMYQPAAPFPWGQTTPLATAPKLLIDVGPLSERDMTYLFYVNRAPFATSMFVTDSLMMIIACTGSQISGTSVYNNRNECPLGIPANHAVVNVGLGTTTNGNPFWYIRNSWGRAWGDDGHIRLLRDSTNAVVPGSAGFPGGKAMCSLGYMNSYPRASGASDDDSCTRFSFQ